MAFVLGVLAVQPAAAQSELSGRWGGFLSTPHGEVSFGLEISQSGGELVVLAQAGTQQGSASGAFVISSSDDKLRFAVAVPTGMGEDAEMTVDVQLTNGVLVGEFNTEYQGQTMGEGAIRLERVEAGSPSRSTERAGRRPHPSTPWSSIISRRSSPRPYKVA